MLQPPNDSDSGQAWDLADLRELLHGIFEIHDVTTDLQRGAGIRVRGRFLIDTGQAYERLAPTCRRLGRTVMFRQEGEDAAIWLLDGVPRPTPNNRWLPIVLALVTVVSVLFSYAFYWGGADLTWSSWMAALPLGLAFTASLLAILVSHELGHFVVARRLGVSVTLPYLIPFPLSPFGTMGAVIRMKGVPSNKRAMLLIGAAGPLAGLVVAVPVLVLGLALSHVEPLPPSEYMIEGNSLLYVALKYLMFGRVLPSGGEDVMIHPVAFAGWAGLLVTALNLMPAGQLDGGHIVNALLGSRARYLSWAVIAALLALSVFWQGWLLWAVLIFVLSRTVAKPLDDITPLTPAEVALGLALMLLFALTFTPLPLRFVG